MKFTAVYLRDPPEFKPLTVKLTFEDAEAWEAFTALRAHVGKQYSLGTKHAGPWCAMTAAIQTSVHELRDIHVS